jgi:DNA-binding CsgD family transcriptional regulator/tetratricopeptide (TPR) repeat protein
MEEGDFAEALELLTAARDLALHRGGCPAEVYEQLGLAAHYSIDVAQARAAWKAGLEMDPDPPTRARLRRALAMLAWDLQEVDEALEHLRTGWRELEGHSGVDVEDLARTELVFTERMLDLKGLEESAERLAVVATTPEARSEVWQARASAYMYRGDPRAVEAGQRGIEEADAATEFRVRHRACHLRNMGLLAMGRPADALAALEREPLIAYYAYSLRAFAGFVLGDLERIREVADEAAASPTAHKQLGPLLSALLAVATADPMGLELVDRALVHARRPRTVAFAKWLRADLLSARDDHQAAVDVLRQSGTIRPDAIVTPLPLEVVRLMGISSIRIGDHDEAETMARTASRWGEYGQEVAALIRAELARSRGEPAAGELEACAEAFAARGMAPLAARARFWAAEGWGGSDVRKARACLDRAWRVWARLGIDPALGRARTLYATLGLPVPVTPRRGATGGPLSEREIDVVRLVARGMTNKEVADVLFLSPHTVATHLKRVYQRLDVHNRAALTRWAAHQGHLGET